MSMLRTVQSAFFRCVGSWERRSRVALPNINLANPAEWLDLAGEGGAPRPGFHSRVRLARVLHGGRGSPNRRRSSPECRNWKMQARRPAHVYVAVTLANLVADRIDRHAYPAVPSARCAISRISSLHSRRRPQTHALKRGPSPSLFLSQPFVGSSRGLKGRAFAMQAPRQAGTGCACRG